MFLILFSKKKKVIIQKNPSELNQVCVKQFLLFSKLETQWQYEKLNRTLFLIVLWNLSFVWHSPGPVLLKTLLVKALLLPSAALEAIVYLLLLSYTLAWKYQESANASSPCNSVWALWRTTWKSITTATEGATNGIRIGTRKGKKKRILLYGNPYKDNARVGLSNSAKMQKVSATAVLLRGRLLQPGLLHNARAPWQARAPRCSTRTWKARSSLSVKTSFKNINSCFGMPGVPCPNTDLPPLCTAHSHM